MAMVMVLMTVMMLVMVQWAVDMSVETAISGIDRKPCYTRITLLTPLLLHMMMMMMVRILGVFGIRYSVFGSFLSCTPTLLSNSGTNQTTVSVNTWSTAMMMNVDNPLISIVAMPSPLVPFLIPLAL